jgi:hypothetical protein
LAVTRGEKKGIKKIIVVERETTIVAREVVVAE